MSTVIDSPVLRDFPTGNEAQCDHRQAIAGAGRPAPDSTQRTMTAAWQTSKAGSNQKSLSVIKVSVIDPANQTENMPSQRNFSRRGKPQVTRNTI